MYGLANKPAKREGNYIHQAFDVGLKSRKTKRENAPFSVAVFGRQILWQQTVQRPRGSFPSNLRGQALHYFSLMLQYLSSQQVNTL